MPAFRILVSAPVLLAGLLAGGCASMMDWARPNTDRVALNSDLQDCERSARAAAPELPTLARGALSGELGLTRNDLTTSEALNTFPQIDASRENSLIAACMQGKGYREIAARDGTAATGSSR